MSPLRTLSARNQRITIFLLGVGMTAVVVLLVGALLSAAKDASETNERGEKRESQVERNDDTLAIIKDCTEPDGKCFKDGQRRTARAVGDIGAGNVLAVVCALQIPDGTPFDVALARVSRCVAAGLRDR